MIFLHTIHVKKRVCRLEIVASQNIVRNFLHPSILQNSKSPPETSPFLDITSIVLLLRANLNYFILLNTFTAGGNTCYSSFFPVLLDLIAVSILQLNRAYSILKEKLVFEPHLVAVGWQLIGLKHRNVEFS